MSWEAMLTGSAFVMASSLWLLVSLLLSGRRNRLDVRLQELASRGEEPEAPDAMMKFARTALPKMGAPLVPKSDEERTKLQTRLLHAGLYHRQAMALFLGVKMLLILAPPLIGLVLGLVGVVPLQKGVVIGGLAGSFGIIAPSFWLDHRKAQRQVTFRRALPDALDVLVICLEGGTSLPGGLQRVAEELQTAHPQLATELNIVQREIQLGRAPGEALREFADRSDLEEVRSLASVVQQSERFGASLVKALRVHAETFRTKRVQHAEVMAQKAVVKILFPTVLFIMPAIFIAILGPLGMQFVETLKSVTR